jgi:hypothetical protein
MFVRTSSRRNKDGTVVRYLQLAHNEWDAAAKASRMRVLYNFGRAEDLDRAAVARLIVALSRLLGELPADGAADGGALGGGLAGLAFTESRPLGGALALDAVWARLGIAARMRTLLGSTRRDAVTERVLFALVANRALAPSSKLAAADWVTHDVHIPGLGEVSDDACYRAMDWLLDVESVLAKDVYAQVADLLNLEVDLLFFDTTSTYFETEVADEPVWRDEQGRPVTPVSAPSGTSEHAQSAPEQGAHEDSGGGADGAVQTDPPGGAVKEAGFRTYGKSKDHREDLPQVVIGMAVTRGGIPVRVWCWPGNTADSALIRQVKADMRDWNLSRVVWVADRGFTSAENRRYLQRAGGGYILGEKLRSGSTEATAALGRAGRYQDVAANLRVKEVRISEHERFVIVHNPESATRDAAVRAELVERLRELIKDSDTLSATKRTELRGVISTKPGLNRFLRATPGGLLRIDATAIAAEARLDGKYLLRTNEPALSAEDIALGYKQLLEVERGWRDMKQILDLRPVHHRLEQRIRAHVILCWLALLLIRIIETTTGDTWTSIRRELQRLAVGTFTGPAGSYRQTTDPTPAQRQILTALDIPTPPRILGLTTPTR